MKPFSVVVLGSGFRCSLELVLSITLSINISIVRIIVFFVLVCMYNFHMYIYIYICMYVCPKFATAKILRRFGFRVQGLGFRVQQDLCAVLRPLSAPRSAAGPSLHGEPKLRLGAPGAQVLRRGWCRL